MKVLFHLWCETIKTEKIEKMEIETEIRQDRGNGAEKTPHFKTYFFSSARNKLYSDNHFRCYKL